MTKKSLPFFRIGWNDQPVHKWNAPVSSTELRAVSVQTNCVQLTLLFKDEQFGHELSRSSSSIGKQTDPVNNCDSNKYKKMV